MRILTAADDGTTSIEFTRAEGEALRDLLPEVETHTGVQRVAVGKLARLLAMIHGEPAKTRREPEPEQLPERVAHLEAAVSHLTQTTGCRCPDQPLA